MFGEVQITKVLQLTGEDTLDEAAAKLLEFKECGAIMTRCGSCCRCGNCGWNSGCS